MDVAVTIIIGFGSAILGAAAGFLGAVHIENQRLARSRTGMLRALQAELQHNVASLYVARHTVGNRKVIEYSDSTWRLVQCDIAQFLDHRLYVKLATMYLSFASLYTTMDMMAEAGVALDEEWQKALDALRTDMQEVREGLLDTPQLQRFKADYLEDWKKGDVFAAGEH